LPGGPGLCVRPIRPAGEACLPRFHAGLSHSSVYQRYFRPIPVAQHARLSHRRGFALRAALAARSPQNGTSSLPRGRIEARWPA